MKYGGVTMPILLKKKCVLKLLDFLIHCVHSTSCLLGSHHFIIADKKNKKYHSFAQLGIAVEYDQS